MHKDVNTKSTCVFVISSQDKWPVRAMDIWNVKIVIDFSYLNDMDLRVFFKSNIENSYASIGVNHWKCRWVIESKLCIFYSFIFKIFWIKKKRFFLIFLNFFNFFNSFLIGENISIWMTPFRFESSCARVGGMSWIILQRRVGEPYLVVLSSECGMFFTMSHTATRASSWPYMDFWIFYIFLRQTNGVGLCPYMGNGCVYGIICERHRFLVCIKLNTPYYSYIPNLCLKLSGYIYS